MDDKYKNKNKDMPLHVPESLFEHYLNESIEAAKEFLSDSNINPENQSYQKFLRFFEQVPDDYLEKFSEWLEDGQTSFNTLLLTFKAERGFKKPIERDIKEFKNFEDYQNYISSFDDETAGDSIEDKEPVVRTSAREREAEESPEDEKTDSEIDGSKPEEEPEEEVEEPEEESEEEPDRDISSKQTKALQKSYEDRESSLFKGIEIVPLLNKRKGFYCDSRILYSDALNKPGQGIYIWTNRAYLELGKNYYKVGQYGSTHVGQVEPKTPDQTIQEYLGKKTNIDDIVILYAIRLDDYILNSSKYKNAYRIEQDIHDLIKRKNGYRLIRGKSTELFAGVSLEEDIKIINEVLYSSPKLKNYPMRPEQKEAHDKMVRNFENGNRKFLLAAKMRFGKNFALLNVVKTLNFKNVLVITYKPHVFNSLESDIRNHVNFDGWDIKQFKEDRNPIASKKKTTIFLSSAQLAQYKKSQKGDDKNIDIENLSIEELRKNLKALKRIPWDMIIIDEYHYGTKTNLFEKTIELLQKNNPYIVYVSGTAMKDIAMGRFEDEEIYEWSYLDEQREKTNEKNGKSPSKEHLSMPTMDMRIIRLSPDIKDIEEPYDIEEGEGLTMMKIIATDSEGNLKNRGKLQRLLEQIIGISSKDVRDNLSPYQMAGIKSNLDHTFWILPKWSKGIIAMAELMKTMPEYSKYDIIEATGNKVTDIEEVQERINRTKDPDYEKKGTITLSCYRFKEGVSIPEWDGVLMLDDGSSVEEYLQAIFRCQNPNEVSKKDKCYVFDFNPDRALSMVYEICENSKKGKDAEIEKVFEEFRDYANVFYNKDNKFEKANFEQIMEAFKSFTSWRERFANIKNIDISKLGEIDLSSLAKVIPGKRKDSMDINNNDIERGKTFMKKPRGEGKGKSEKDQTKSVLVKITTVLGNIPEFLFNTPNNEQNVEQIINTGDPSLFYNITKINISTFSDWVDKGLINIGLMNRNITAFILAEEQLMKNPTGENIEEFFKKNFQLRADYGKTPIKLVKEMLDRFPNDTWSDPNKKFLDPCMGIGTFLIEIKDRLKKNLHSIPEKEREKYIMDNMIYGIDIDKSKYNMALKLFGTNINNEHIINKDSLSYNFKDQKGENMKFDVVVGNPPYNKGIGKNTPYEEWGDRSKNGSIVFIKLACDIAKDGGNIIFVQPPSIFLSESAEKTRNFILQNCTIQEIKRLGFHDFENVHQLTCIIDIKKVPGNNTNIRLLRNHFGTEYESFTSPFGKKNILPFFIGEEGKDIFLKVQNKVKEVGSFKIIESDGIKTNDHNGKYKVIHRLFGKDSNWSKKHHAKPFTDKLDALFSYTNEKKAGIGIPKVFPYTYSRPVQRSMGSNYMDETGKYATTETAISCKNEMQARNVYSFLNSNIPSFILYMVKYNMHTREEMLQYFPYPPSDRIMKESDFYEWLDINSGERKFMDDFMNKGDYIN